MKTAVDFLAEWASGEAWKIHVLNRAKKKGEIDSSHLLGEVLQLIKTQP